MYKVVIIDDEPVVRKGMVNVIRWKELGCEVVGEAADGLKGKEAILELKPDIILTDIYMPEISGLQMIRETISEVPHAQIIVLTGYRDFDYIQEALRLGAADYILKPSKLDAIVACVKKAIKALDEKEVQKEHLRKLEGLFKKARPALLEKRLKDVINKISTVDDTYIEELKLFGFELDHFFVTLVEIEDKPDAYGHQLNKIGLRNAFTESFAKDFAVTPIDMGNQRILFIHRLEGGFNSEEFFELDAFVERLEEFMHMIREVFGIEFDCAISKAGQGIGELYQKSKECIRTIDYKHYVGQGAILLAQDFETESYDDIGVLSGLQEPLLNAVKVGNVLVVEELLDKLKVSFEKKYCFKSFDIKDFIVRLTYDVYNFVLTHSELDPEYFKMSGMAIQEVSSQGRDIEPVYELLKNWAIKVASKRHSDQNQSIDGLVVKAMSYMKKHFSENLSLKEVAAHINISTYYLSRLFKRETGMNFSEYLVDYRIEKAKVMLEDTEMKLYEIADSIGLSDPHYFSRTFKKNTGMTPTQYREKNRYS